MNHAYNMKILIISDTHNTLEFGNIKEISEEYNACFTLGDISWNDYSIIKEVIPHSIPIYGVLGNHNDFNDLEHFGIQNIHGKKIYINDISFIGWQGSIKYKNTDYPSFTDKESISFAKILDKADVLISHEGPKYLYHRDLPHSGLTGITKYLKKNKTPLIIHGHHHMNKIQTLKNGTICTCIYGTRILDLSKLLLSIN